MFRFTLNPKTLFVSVKYEKHSEERKITPEETKLPVRSVNESVLVAMSP